MRGNLPDWRTLPACAKVARRSTRSPLEKRRTAGRIVSHATPTTSELERLVDLSLDMLCVTTLSSRFLVVNPAWTLTLGWSEEELRACRVIDLVHPDDRERALAAATRLAEPGTELQDFEMRVRHKDGSHPRVLSDSPHRREGA